MIKFVYYCPILSQFTTPTQLGEQRIAYNTIKKTHKFYCIEREKNENNLTVYYIILNTMNIFSK